jgi:hypothetical protein
MTSAFERQVNMSSEPHVDPLEAALAKKEAEKAAREAEKKRKEAEKKEAKRLADEAAAKAAEEKKAAAAEAAQQAEKDKELMTTILASKKTGESLVEEAKAILKSHKMSPAVVMAALLQHNQFTAISSSKWMTPSEYGAFMAYTIGAAAPKDQLKALYAMQLFMHEHRGLDGNKTKGMMELGFKALYAFDVVSDEAFIEYKYDTEDNTLGKMQAIIETSEWLSWLEENEDEDEDEDENEDDDDETED